MASVLARDALPAGYRLLLHDRLDSTNDEALRRLADGTGRPGDVIVARSQTAGRGRRGRRWESPAGNLHLTIIAAVPADRPPGQLAFVAALAAGEGAAAFLPASCEIRYKWPNDILLDRRKLGGILIEGGGSGAMRGWAVGIGLNVAATPSEPSFPAAALRQAGADVAAEALIAPVCTAFARWRARWAKDGFAPIRAAWLERAHGLGAPVEVHMPDGSIRRGDFADLDGDGALVLQAGSGVSRVAAGDVFFAPG